MSLRFAPNAIRSPISRVRSVTLTSMMFMIPMPPTNNEIEAIATKTAWNIWVTWPVVSAISVVVRTVNGLILPLATR